MQKKEDIIIYHIYRKDGSSLFLHPLSDQNFILKLDGGSQIRGKYGHEPRVEALTMFRNDLYRSIEGAVKNWIGDIKFIPRFIMSAALFLLIYIFTAAVIRDPIPLIDEIALALGGSIAFFFIMAKRDQSSSRASKKRLELRTIVDRIVFEEDLFMKEIEEMLHYNESVDSATLLESMMIAVDDSKYSGQSLEDLKRLIGYLDKRFSTKIYKRKLGTIERLNSARNKTEKLNEISKWADTNKIDLSLFAMYRKLKKKVPT